MDNHHADEEPDPSGFLESPPRSMGTVQQTSQGDFNRKYLEELYRGSEERAREHEEEARRKEEEYQTFNRLLFDEIVKVENKQRALELNIEECYGENWKEYRTTNQSCQPFGSNQPISQVNNSSGIDTIHRTLIPDFGVQTQLAKILTIKIFRGEVGENPHSHLDSLRDFFSLCKMNCREQTVIASHYLSGYARDWWGMLTKKPSDFANYSNTLLKYYWSEDRQSVILNTICREKYEAIKETCMQFFIRLVGRFRSLTAFEFSDSYIIRTIQLKMPLPVQRLMVSSRIKDVEVMAEFLMTINYGPWNLHRQSEQNTRGGNTRPKRTVLAQPHNAHPPKGSLLGDMNPVSMVIREEDPTCGVPIGSCPIINVGVGSIEIPALIDTGSQISCISKGWLLRMEEQSGCIPRLPSRPIQMKLADGKRTKTEAYQVWLEIIFKKITIGHTFLVIKGLVHDVIIGSDFLTQNKCILDYATNSIMVQQEKIYFNEADVLPGIQVQCMEASIDENTIKDKVKESSLETIENQSQLHQLLMASRQIFSPIPGEIKGYVHRIRVKEETHFQARTYPIPFQYQDEVSAQIQQMITWGVIEKGSSPYNNPLVVVKKKNGSIRLCLDARRLNSITIPERDIPPPVQEVFLKLSTKNIFSTLDLTASYWQMILHPQDRKYTAFRHNGQTHLFKRVPFGLINSGAGLMRCLDQVLSEDLKQKVVCYIDDVVIASRNPQEHLEHLKQFFSECAQKNITVNLEKSHFALKEIAFLGHIVNGQGIRTHPDKVEAIQNFPRPINRKQIRSFLGLCNYYHKFYPGFAKDTSTLLELLQQHRRWGWSEQHEQDFKKIKDNFLQTVMLCYPDFTRPFYLQTDSSKKGLGVVLFQVNQAGQHQVLYFSSRTLRGAEKNYTVTEQETLAIVWACSKFKQILLGSEVIIITDHRCLEFLNKSYLNNDRLIRWSLSLQKFHYRIIYCPGPENIVADVLSRHPVEIKPCNPMIPDQPLIIMANVLDQEIEKKLKNLQYWQEKQPQYRELIQEVQKQGNPAQGCTTGRGKRRYRLQNGLLLQQTENRLWKILIPPELRSPLITYMHSLVGHYGPRKTEEALRRQFHWPHMYSDILHALRKCNTCAKSKPPNKIFSGTPASIIPLGPNKVLAVDHYGPLPSYRRCRYLFVTYDIFSKYAWAYPVIRADSKSAIKALQCKQFVTIGKPESILSDHGSAFTSREWQTWIKSQGLRHVMTSIRNPQSNPCERVMREINRLFRTYIHDNHRGWVNRTEEIFQYINGTINEATGLTPMRLHFGKPEQPLIKIPLPKDDQEVDKEEDRRAVHHRLKARAEKKQLKETRSYQFRVGDHVWVRTPKPSSRDQYKYKKFFPLYQGPYVIKRVSGPNAYLLEDNGAIRGTYNARSLKPFVDHPPDPGL